MDSTTVTCVMTAVVGTGMVRTTSVVMTVSYVVKGRVIVCVIDVGTEVLTGHPVVLRG